MAISYKYTIVGILFKLQLNGEKKNTKANKICHLMRV